MGNGNNRPLCVAVQEERMGWEVMIWRGGQKTITEDFGQHLKNLGSLKRNMAMFAFRPVMLVATWKRNVKETG